MRTQIHTFYRPLLAVALCATMAASCDKKNFLEEPPSTDLLIPKTLTDFRLLLENDVVMYETPMMGEVSADNYYIADSYYESLKSREHNCYTWENDVYFDDESSIDDWDKPYQQIFYANTVIEGLRAIKSDFGGNRTEWENLFGQALFIRAYAFYNLAQVFSPPYDKSISTEENKFGIPLRQNTDIGNVPRSTVMQTYDSIEADLKRSIALIHQTLDINHLNRPSKEAAYALMARVQISMREYPKALLYADSCLSTHNSLIDYNSVDTLTPFPFSKTNIETLYQSRLLNTNKILNALVVPFCYVDSTLYAAYSSNDLRRLIYYSGTSGRPTLKGGYTGSIFLFTGLASDEMYLIKSECLARDGNYVAAMGVLNSLLIKRYKNGTFVPLYAADAEAALDTILIERRKELAFRGLRWTDLRRLNKEGRNITLRRKVNGIIYELPPNSKKYVFSLPYNVWKLGNVSDYTRN